MIWLLQMEIMKWFHCSQVSSERECWTNLQNPGALLSSVFDRDGLFSKMELDVLWVWESLNPHVQFCLLTSLNHAINSDPLTAAYLVQPSPTLSQRFRALPVLCSVRFLFLSKLAQRECSTLSSKALKHFKATWWILRDGLTLEQQHYKLYFDGVIFHFEAKTAFSVAHCNKGQYFFPPEN